MTDDFSNIHGNGIDDDTSAIQKLLDSGRSCVELPPPEKHYLISRPLEIGSGQELRLPRFAVIRLADHSDCMMLRNRTPEEGNRHIRVTGGIWDANNMGNTPNLGAVICERRLTEPDFTIEDPYGPGFNRNRRIGEIMYFENVQDFELADLTFRNPTTYAFHACLLSYFAISNIEFDFSTWNPQKANMDGIHLDGCCHHGKISNLRGTCWDDLLALNANDGGCAFREGPITDIDVDGIYCDYCHSAIRLLSTQPEAFIKRISIRNIHGNFYRYAVGLTHFFEDRETRGVFDDISISDCFVGKAPMPEDIPWGKYLEHFAPIYCDASIDVGSLCITRLFREETCEALPTITTKPTTCVEALTCCDCVNTNCLKEPLVFLKNAGRIGNLTLQNIHCVSAPGAGASTVL